MKQKRFTHPRLLRKERQSTPTIPADGDELFQNGVFRIHISAMLNWMTVNPQPIVRAPVKAWTISHDMEECFVVGADITKPIVVAEIAPDFCDFSPVIPRDDWISRGYVCIDGNHRIEQARRKGLEVLPAVALRMEQFIPFMCDGYDRYVEYWNRKLEERVRDAQLMARNK